MVGVGEWFEAVDGEDDTINSAESSAGVTEVAQHPGSVEFARRIRAEVQNRTLESEGRMSVVFRKVRTVFQEAGGWSRRGSENVGLVVDALNAEKVYWRGDLEDDDFDDIVWFALYPIQGRPPVAKLSTERDLRTHMEANYRLLFDRVQELGGLELVAAEVEYQRTPSELRPDLLFTDSEGRSVVVELEVGDPQENSAFQVLKYMNAADARLGVLITARSSNDLLELNMKEALDLMKPEKPNIWLVYSLSPPDGRLSLAQVR